MSKIIFTLCSNNYLAQAKVLAASVRQHQPGWKFVLGLVDTKLEQVDYLSFGFEVVTAADIEPAMQQLAEKYSIIELNTCLKPAFFLYFFQQRQAQHVVYLDPDISLYSPLREMEIYFLAGDIILTPHVVTPIPLDGRTPGEKLFLNYGLYNLGFLALKKSHNTERFLYWWKERTYAQGYDRPAEGLFTDQLWINLVPIYFPRVKVLRHTGYNMAPWNLHERYLEDIGGEFRVAPKKKLVFFHFSGFDLQQNRLHKDYSRFHPDQRPDLRRLYDDYGMRLREEDHAFYSSLPCYYREVRNIFLRRETIEPVNGSPNRLIRRIKKMMPSGLKRATLNLIKA
ncbi:hypothetical protein Q4E93_07405 [Flavitalea sp. BT771]|uniref:hypothetical protein n=1 Tax=Flavitalea sp. BT771 TaxID=3063329 RepID=UPI0026E1F0E5|nr:hypothetical protein [Flavitalea sp. BT771]MDO6430406.1 hypothetical protein [Flavitalea sp. BT771]MDV6219454.1 hypothetical protein [Flavitalea sp. BT771]